MSEQHNHRISNATIEWKDDVPCSSHFDDIYFSREGGTDETQHVFIDGNDLSNRFKSTEQFTIIETGFGTGLNFLVTADLWLRIAPENARLHFISTEKFPLSIEHLRQAHQHFPQLQTLCDALQQSYPPAANGFHRISIANGRIFLTLLYGDINDTLPSLEAKADAWFLDGFAPAKNPDMWSDTVFKQIGRLSKEGTTCATYSCAAIVKSGLKSAGFTIEKAKGFGRKRDMLKASYSGNSAFPQRKNKTPWFTVSNPFTPKHKSAIIIGGGLAGCFASYALATRGFSITLIERHNDICQEASGNPAGILQPAITAPQHNGGRFYMEGFLHSLRLIKQHNIDFRQTGALHLTNKRYNASCIIPDAMMKWLTAEDANQRASLTLKNDAPVFWLPDAGYINPHHFAENMLQLVSENVNKIFHTEAISLSRQKNNWQVFDAQKSLITEAEIAVICNANDAPFLAPISPLPLQPVRGQITYLPTSEKTASLKTIICHDNGYILPSNDEIHIIGATYEQKTTDTKNLLKSHERNIAGLRRIADIEEQSAEKLDGRSSLRCTTPDRLPIVGPAPDFELFKKHYKSIFDGTKRGYPEGTFQPGLYVSLGHGSRGLTSCLISGEILASYITGEPMPIEIELLHAIHPARFCIRDLKRKIG